MGCKVAVGMGVIVGVGVDVGLGVFVIMFVEDGITSTGGPINSAVAPIVFGLLIWAKFEQDDIEKINTRSMNDKGRLYFCLNIVLFT
jgi:hypothetical protein